MTALALLLAVGTLQQTLATDIVWREQYGEESSPPPLTFVTGKKLDCYSGGGFMFDMPEGRMCLGGVFAPKTYQIQVAHPRRFKWSESSFAHELWHAHMWNLFRDADHYHTSTGYKPGGAVEKANQALRRAGL